MDRRTLMTGGVAGMLAGLSGLATEVVGEETCDLDCCPDCTDCRTACLACVAACLDEGGDRKDCIKLCLDCRARYGGGVTGRRALR